MWTLEEDIEKYTRDIEKNHNDDDAYAGRAVTYEELEHFGTKKLG